MCDDIHCVGSQPFNETQATNNYFFDRIIHADCVVI